LSFCRVVLSHVFLPKTLEMITTKVSRWLFIGPGNLLNIQPGNTKGGSITVPLTSCLTCWDQPVLQIKTKIVSCHTVDSKPVKQEVKSTVILPPLVFPDSTLLKRTLVLLWLITFYFPWIDGETCGQIWSIKNSNWTNTPAY